MAGYSGTPLITKLGIKDGHTVLLDGQPDTVDLGDLGAAHVVRRLPRAAVLDVTLTFHLERARFERRLPQLVERTVRERDDLGVLAEEGEQGADRHHRGRGPRGRAG